MKRVISHSGQDAPHGVAGQINICVLDKDSDITGFGKHNRLLVFGSQRSITLREDIRGLPLSTEDDRKKCLNSWQRLHPKGITLEWESSVEYEGHQGRSIEHSYRYK